VKLKRCLSTHALIACGLALRTSTRCSSPGSSTFAISPGSQGSAALLLVTADGATFVTDGRYRDQSADQLVTPAWSRHRDRPDSG